MVPQTHTKRKIQESIHKVERYNLSVKKMMLKTIRLMKEIKGINKWKDSLCLWIGRQYY